jgi:hypothetical protein
MATLGARRRCPTHATLMASWGARESEHRRGNEKEHTREREDWQARELAKLDERERRNCNEFILARDEASLLETRFTYC